MKLPVSDRHLPRRDRQYPYRPATDEEREEINAEADALLVALRPSILHVAKVRLPNRLHSLYLDDLAQELAMHLVLYVLPKYDAHRRPAASPRTFLERSLWWAVTKPTHRLQRQHRRPVDFDTPNRDMSTAIAIDRLVADILARPKDYVGTALHAATITHADPQLKLEAQARLAGYSTAAVKGARRRITARFRELVDDLALAGHSGRHS